MSHSASSLSAFHLLGDRSGLAPDDSSSATLYPALYSQYCDLSGIRYDYPVVLVNPPTHDAWVISLKDIIDDLLRTIAMPGAEGEAMRNQVLALELAIRKRVENGQKGSLSLFWEAARREVVGNDGEPAAGTVEAGVNQNLLLAGADLKWDGEVIPCDEDLAARLAMHAWTLSETSKSEFLRRRIIHLQQALTDILAVDDLNSSSARNPDRLEASMGTTNQSVFDFQAMARILRTAPVAEPLPEQRTRRIRNCIDVLKSQKFVSLPGTEASANHRPYRFAFIDPREAEEAYRSRLPEMATLIRAISIAQLEIDNRYQESQHDEFFDRFDENRLGPADIALFPVYFLTVTELNEQSQDDILHILRAGLPFKIVAQSDDILGNDAIDEARLSFGTGGQHLARMATGLDRIFVMQAASSTLYQQRDGLLQGLQSQRPALFSIYSGAAQPNLPSYLLAAAANESRVFPSFIYDPSAGFGQATRYQLGGNPQPAVDWTLHELAFEAADHNRQSQKVAFTPVDFMAADPRYADRFARIPADEWNTDMVPAGEYLAWDDAHRAGKIPYLLVSDPEGILHRAVFDDLLLDALDRILDSWHGLQELAGIHNSHVEKALNEARRQWEQEKAELSALAANAASTGAPAADSPATTPHTDSDVKVEASPPLSPEESEPATPTSDDPWIETIRCTTCNECTQLNDRMFAYDEDKRAYVADPDAGTFRELVEAAETCQVAIIHPGVPRNPDEPGLEELMERAEPFNA